MANSNVNHAGPGARAGTQTTGNVVITGGISLASNGVKPGDVSMPGDEDDND